MIDIEFGVMSKRWSMKAKNLEVAKIAMVLFINQNIPIAIYKPETSGAFIPKRFMENTDIDSFEREDISEAYKSIVDMHEVEN